MGCHSTCYSPLHSAECIRTADGQTLNRRRQASVQTEYTNIYSGNMKERICLGNRWEAAAFLLSFHSQHSKYLAFSHGGDGSNCLPVRHPRPLTAAMTTTSSIRAGQKKMEEEEKDSVTEAVTQNQTQHGHISIHCQADAVMNKTHPEL